MEIIGRFSKLLPLESGTSARGEWKKQGFIIETEEQYPRKVHINLWGEKVQEIAGIQQGELLTVSVNVESREFNERWYTDVRAWRIQRGAVTPTQQAGTGTGTGAPMPPPPQEEDYAASNESFDDLPF
ncbi:MAG: DUF3127 domain-containing protein [Prevotellaceae bacterium]|jgi:hypothetical protein|nr:DUF3127 domain-containing protein [Prevotellaceae bacterium]